MYVSVPVGNAIHINDKCMHELYKFRTKIGYKLTAITPPEKINMTIYFENLMVGLYVFLCFLTIMINYMLYTI